jgi:hypothetical protein
LKKFTFLALAALFIIPFSLQAQQIKRCITEEKMQELFQQDPQARLRYEATRKMLDEKVQLYMNNPEARMMKTNAIITIPVVVHIALPNPNLVTDATVQNQLDTLNWYYGNAPLGDSMRVYEPFRSVYGRSQIRFCLAKRTPSNQATTGIERVVSNVDFSTTSAHPSSVIPAWSTQTYLNMWVVNFGNTGTLGFSYKPGTWPIGSQNIGYVVDYRAFGSGPSASGGGYHYNQYNGGMTAVHEIGHYFNLDHTWGPNNTGNPTCTLTDQCADTPPTNGPTFNCTDFPPLTNSCSPSAPGVMWQNHMDYANDACMLLFTANQVTRMEAALNNAPDRTGLITSNGCQALGPIGNDAGISAIVTPVNGNVFCSSSVTPVVTLKNFGATALTSVKITITLNGTAQSPYSWTGNLATGASTNVTLPAINLAGGNNNIVAATSLPNNSADGVTNNDQSSVSVTYSVTTTLPLVQGFEAAGFPPSPWVRVNPDGDATQWQRASVGKNSNASMWINNFTTDVTNTIDDFRSAPFSTAGVNTLNISFDLAHKYYPQNGLHDTLSILVSADCGATYETVYKKWGASLATAGSSNQAYNSPAAGDWRTEVVPVSGAILSNPQLLVTFRNTSKWGNNIFIDNINIQKQSTRDLRLVSVNTTPLTCATNVTPSVTILNNGAETITGFDVGFTIDNGTIVNTSFVGQSLAPGATITVPLNQSGALGVGGRNITAFTFNASSLSGTGDIQTNNDTLSNSFYIAGSTNAPLVESFSGNDFPPAGWSVINPDRNISWNRHNSGNVTPGSAFMNTFNYTVMGERDALVTPNVNFSDVDSVKLTFDVAAAIFANTGTVPLDTLEVLISKDCGNSFTSVYKKWGQELQTVTLPSTPVTEFFPTAPSQWRNETIDLTGFGGSGPVMVFFRTTNNFENNIFIDNVNLTTRILPDRIKQQGYLILPTPFTSTFNVWFVQPPTDLRYINVYNSIGQLVFTKEFNGTTINVHNVNLANKASGIYFVKLGFEDESKNVSERVIKL